MLRAWLVTRNVACATRGQHGFKDSENTPSREGGLEELFDSTLGPLSLDVQHALVFEN